MIDDTLAPLNLHRSFTIDFNEDSFGTDVNKYLVLAIRFYEEKRKHRENTMFFHRVKQYNRKTI